ncbi:hypothetical protein SAMN02745181_1507 [Rubritalea squalenifaciens DSM 18772]|uniref:Uncharacterized protein n=1 Tax=Rubritalea squalenifaciens DSM 18772 TaxID=1123071 RepID=A0A1M6HLI8_9BACT|nr:hypothetical protein SAMN02745181_1507 [Rubritalea squalenifaciens DSM 18772]
MALARLFLLYILLSGLSSAGSRGLTAIGMINATPGEEPAISKRLYELLQNDARIIFLQSATLGFPWEGSVKIIRVPKSPDTFKALITPTSKKQVAKLVETHQAYDGLIVYQYDAQSGHARLKLFDSKGNERILVKLPLEKAGPMKGSLLRLTRRSALVAIGGSIDFVP